MNGWTDRQVDFEQINTNRLKISPSPHSSLNKVENSNRFFTCDISSKFCQLLSHPQIEFYALLCTFSKPTPLFVPELNYLFNGYNIPFTLNLPGGCHLDRWMDGLT